MTLPKLGFRQKSSDKDKHFPISKLMGAVSTMPVSKVWRAGPVTNQRDTNGCVGHSCFKLLTSEPVLAPQEKLITPEQIYLEARQNDEWPGEADEGTSVRAGLEALKRHGLISGYYWSDDHREAVEYLLSTGPLVIGINWYESMFNVDSLGFIRPGGSIVGGHAILVYAADWQDRFITLRNSWGNEFGMTGDCLMTFEDFDRLLKEDGVCAAVSEPILA